MDFYQIKTKWTKNGAEIYPDFKVCRSKDLMIRGRSFYAIWDENRGLWSTDEYDVQRLVDEDLIKFANEYKGYNTVDIKKMSEFSSRSWTQFKNYIFNSPDNAHPLDERIIFNNTPVQKKDYVSRKLPYSLEPCDISAYDELIGTLYSPEERVKIEWAIGAIISGDSKKIQKFIVLYGEGGTGKSTILKIIKKIFEGYCATFEAKALTSSSNVFSTEAFRDNPLVAIQDDGDLSKIEDNSKLNSIISHEEIIINPKYKTSYPAKLNCFLFMGTNKPVKITDAKSGIIRRLIDVRPTGNKIPFDKYESLMNEINFELGGIACHCLDVYNSMGKNYYSTYKPIDMMYKTDPFFNFVEDMYDIFAEEDGVPLSLAYKQYKEYCDDSGSKIVLQKYIFREELKNYFRCFDEAKKIDGKTFRSYYSGFIKEKFDRSNDMIIDNSNNTIHEDDLEGIMELNCTESLLDSYLEDCKAQYATSKETPSKKWSDVDTTLKDINTKRLHYVNVPEEMNLIVIDFDLKDEFGNKSLELNLKEASKWPKTYAETSKSGCGIHLHYIYTGDTSQLSRVYSEHIEIKVFNGDSSLRRKVIKCNDIPIATINSGLPLKVKGDKMVNKDCVKNEAILRTLIKRNLKKEYHPGTKPSIDFIYYLLEEAYNSGIKYDVSDMEQAILIFANNSTNQRDYCVKLVGKMKFKSEEVSEPDNFDSDDLFIFDVEVFPNLFVCNYKKVGLFEPIHHMINPKPSEIESLAKNKLIGYNCRRYDNHILYARMMGYNNAQLFNLSQKIINNEKGCFFGEAYNLSYTDIYDFSSKKQSLKKFEIELRNETSDKLDKARVLMDSGMSLEDVAKEVKMDIDILTAYLNDDLKITNHMELGLPWDEPVPKELWEKVADYCDNDIIATEDVWNSRQSDFVAREILAELAGGTVNDTTNSLTTKLIFRDDKKPQKEFRYRNLALPVTNVDEEMLDYLKDNFPDMIAEKHHGNSILPYFPGYEYDRFAKKSIYKGIEVGEGGRVYAVPGMYYDVWTFDVTSMHPSSAEAEYAFGIYTKIFTALKKIRIYIKHGEINKALKLFDGSLKKYLEDEKMSKGLSNALKIVINSVYGLTAASFDNAFKDPRNIDNLIAKRGALFMIDLQEIVEKAGGKVVHIKTDSIKVEHPTEEIKELIINTGKRYGYTFEVEHVFEKFCLVNDAVYVGLISKDDPDKDAVGKWTATGAQFQVPYVFKTLFSKEDIKFHDLCETKSVSTLMYLDMNENLEDVSDLEKDLKKLETKFKKQEIDNDIYEEEKAKLVDAISKGHEYVFVGKVGQFCPIKPGFGGGDLLRIKDNKYYAVTGTKGYKWMESDKVEALQLKDAIDLDYYNSMVDDAIETISQYGDVEKFIDI